MALANPPFYILHHDNTVIHQEAERHYKADNTELIEIIPEKIEQDDTDAN